MVVCLHQIGTNVICGAINVPNFNADWVAFSIKDLHQSTGKITKMVPEKKKNDSFFILFGAIF